MFGIDNFYGNQENDWTNPLGNVFGLFNTGNPSTVYDMFDRVSPDNSNNVNNTFNDSNNDFSRYYQSYGGQTPQAVSPNDFEYLDPNDPEIAKLRDLGAKNSGAGQTLENYYASMPTREKFKPGWKDNLLAILYSALSKTGAKGAFDYLDRPYNEAITEWKMKGPGVTQTARNLEANKTSELNAVKLGLNLRTAAAKARAGQTNAGNRLAAGNARAAISDANTDEAMKLRREEAEDRQESRQSRRRLSNLDEQIKAEELKNLRETGRRQIPAEHEANLTAARTAASKDIMAEFPELFDPETGGFKLDVDELTKMKIKRYRDSLTAIYQKGKRPIDLEEGF